MLKWPDYCPLVNSRLAESDAENLINFVKNLSKMYVRPYIQAYKNLKHHTSHVHALFSFLLRLICDDVEKLKNVSQKMRKIC